MSVDRESRANGLAFRFNPIEQLPWLAWVARVDHGESSVSVWHGPGVETRSGLFVEGAWGEEYADGALDASCVLMGSGGRIRNGSVCFASPCHTLECLFLVKRQSQVLVSNSLALLLEKGGLELDPHFPGYKPALDAIKSGLSFRRGALPTRNGETVELHYYGNLHLDPSLSVEVHEKPVPASWARFEDYRGFLKESMQGCVKNARSPDRRHAFDLLTTISSGYDSAAVAALAAEIGCRRAVTFRQGYRLYDAPGPEDDSGAGIGHVLGLDVTTVSVGDHDTPPQSVPEFAACGDDMDRTFGYLAGELPRTLFFTGMQGDHVWDVKTPPSRELLRDGFSVGSSLGEFRLRTGFVHVPVPFFGAVRQPEIGALSQSPEMRPWSIGGTYDRPIPRRIVEEKGVPRESFGRVKKASARAIPVGPSLRSFMRQRRRLRDLPKTFLCRVRGKALWWASRAVRPHAARFTLANRMAVSLQLCMRRHKNSDRYAVQWGNFVLQQRYREQLRERTPEDHRGEN